MSARLLVAVLIAGCSNHESAPPPPVAAPVAAPPALPAELASLVKKSVLALGPFDWPAGGKSAIVLDDARDAHLVWRSTAGSGEMQLPAAPTSTAQIDVDKDGRVELVLFGSPSVTNPTAAWIVGIEPATKQPGRMAMLELQVLGATDVPSLDRELAATSLGSTKDVPAVRIVARLSMATPNELQALVGARGLRLCARAVAKVTCETIAQKSIDEKWRKAILARTGTFSAFQTDEQGELLHAPTCTVDPEQHVSCRANIGGPVGGSWLFEKAPDGLRLAEVASWSED